MATSKAQLQAELEAVNTAITDALNRQATAYSRGGTSYSFHRLQELREHRNNIERQLAIIDGSSVAVAAFQRPA